MGSTIGEPFLLYSTNAQTKKGTRPVYTTYNPKFRGHATVTIQGDGLRIVDVRILGFLPGYQAHRLSYILRLKIYIRWSRIQSVTVSPLRRQLSLDVYWRKKHKWPLHMLS